MRTFVLILFVCLTNKSYSCDCVRTNAYRLMRYADFVFIGEVVDASNLDSVVVKIKRVVKGSRKEELIAISGGSGDCSVLFFDNEKYLIFGRETQPSTLRSIAVWTDACSTFYQGSKLYKRYDR